MRKHIEEKYDFVEDIEMGAFPLSDIPDDYIILNQSLCVYGEPILIPKLKIGKELARHSPTFHNRFKWFEKFLQKDESEEENKKGCVWLMKGLLRVGFELTMERSQKYTRDLYRCYETFAEYYPEKESEMREVLDLALNPTADKNKMKEIMENLGEWLLAEVPKYFEVKTEKLSMKFQNGYIEIKSDKFLYWYSKLTGTKGNVKSGAFFPFIFTSTKIHPKMREYFINHERIHFSQQIEKLLVGQLIFSFLETLYFRIFKGKLDWDTYILKVCEQEAYDNMFNLDYLKNRKAFSDLRKYLKYKPVSLSSLSKKNLETEGFPIVYDWYDEPNTKYPLHKHQGKVSFYVLDGQVTFLGGINQTVSKGDRIDVSPQVEHSAIVGANGCRYVVAQEIEGDT